ncbi:MAG: hypothetical protein ACLR8P_07075 [Clostridium fessum]
MRASRSYREFYRRLLTELYGAVSRTSGDCWRRSVQNADPGDCRETACFWRWPGAGGRFEPQ